MIAQCSIHSDFEESTGNVEKSLFSCPVCYVPLTRNAVSGLSVDSTAGSCLECETCKKSYFGNETHLDLTEHMDVKPYEPLPASTTVYKFALMSFIYERGWRQTFSIILGFPGPKKEFELMKDYLKPVMGGNIVDASCGSGLFSRRFAESGLFSFVVALDFSENMLRECYKFIKKKQNFPKENIVLVRADISRLPFASGSVDAVHAGAALHCWPSPSAAVAEISRVLRPGGVFVATTFIFDDSYSFGRLLSRITGKFFIFHMFKSDDEIEDLCTKHGLVGFTKIRIRRFAMISVRKPSIVN